MNEIIQDVPFWIWLHLVINMFVGLISYKLQMLSG